MRDDEVMDMNLSAEDMLDDLHALDRELAAFELKYRMLSEDFFALYQQGRVEDSLDIHEWAGLYKAKLNLKDLLRERLGDPATQADHLKQRQSELATA
jgi:uncharacterized protein YfaA (DUF2138 family)